MKNSLLLFLVVILLISLAGNWIQLRSARDQENWRDQDNSRFQKEQARKLGQIQARDSVISSLLIERKTDSTNYASEQGRLKTRLNALRAKVTGPAVVQDTIIVYQDSLIASISAERDTLYLHDNAALDSLQASVTQLKGMYADQSKRAARFQQDYDREKRKRFSLGVGIGINHQGLIMPTVGIQYQLFRFSLKKPQKDY